MDTNIYNRLDTKSYLEDQTFAPPNTRRVFRKFAIAVSFLALWLTPAFSADALNWVIVGCILLCLWDPVACLFLLIASAAVYYVEPDMPEKVFAISPTRIVGAALFVRCLISPGLSIIIKSVGSMSPIAKIFLLLYIISVVVAGCGTGNIASVIAISAALTTFVIVAALVYQINDSRWVALAIITGLLLASSYYILIWSGFLSPILIARISPTGQESLRITASRSSLNYTGSLMSVCFASLVFAYLSGSYKRKRIIALGLSLFVFTTMMDVGSRGAIVASIFGLFAAIVLAAKTRGIQGMYRTLGLFLASIIFVAVSYTHLTLPTTERV